MKWKSWKRTYGGALLTLLCTGPLFLSTEVLSHTLRPGTYSGGAKSLLFALNTEYVSAFSLECLTWQMTVFMRLTFSLTRCGLLRFLSSDRETFLMYCFDQTNQPRNTFPVENWLLQRCGAVLATFSLVCSSFLMDNFMQTHILCLDFV